MAESCMGMGDAYSLEAGVTESRVKKKKTMELNTNSLNSLPRRRSDWARVRKSHDFERFPVQQYSSVSLVRHAARGTCMHSTYDII